MELTTFIKEIAAEFEHEANINSQTKFRQLKSWDSMHALIVIARIDELYDVTLSADDLNSVASLEELYNSVQSLSK